ncbi:hypothetical protein DENSPDRAFT_656957 [Dentipellis sp. KUC8613]|nr:hypothetical protein DENSPDRAFT_656957 [Dentipellis sp. KUC8613]
MLRAGRWRCAPNHMCMSRQIFGRRGGRCTETRSRPGPALGNSPQPAIHRNPGTPDGQTRMYAVRKTRQRRTISDTFALRLPLANSRSACRCHAG